MVVYVGLVVVYVGLGWFRVVKWCLRVVWGE